MSLSIENVTCKFCGCLCDDIVAEVEDGRIIKAKNACPNGRSMFLDYNPEMISPEIEGEETSWDEAIKSAAKNFPVFFEDFFSLFL